MTNIKKSSNQKDLTKTKSNLSSKSSAKPLPPLTFKEKSVLEFIEGFIRNSGVSPSYQEVKEHFGFASFNSVQNYLKQLTSKGYISMNPHQKRALQVLQSPNSLQKNTEALHFGSTATGPSSSQLLQAREEVLSLPLLGKVAAGRPIEALTHDEFIDVPPSYIKKPQQTYALKVQGQSMIDDGIFDGDIILVQESSSAKNGDIVVATVDGEATVKRFYAGPRPGSQSSEKWIELRPSNTAMDSFWYQPDQVQIKGLVMSLLRRFQ